MPEALLSGLADAEELFCSAQGCTDLEHWGILCVCTLF